MVHDAVSRHQAKVLSLDVFREHICPGVQKRNDPAHCTEAASTLFASCQTLPTLNQATELLINEAMKRADGNITQAAAYLGISRQALSKRLRRDIDSENN